MTSAGQPDESGQGPKRTVAIAVARFLKIQPGIYRLQTLPPDRPVTWVMELQKLRPPSALGQWVGRRTKTMI
jgi:hypothetical protein